MKSLKRLLAVAACAAILVSGTGSPAAAHSRPFDYPTPDGFYRSVACPHPTLITPYGPLTVCTSGTSGVVEPHDVGFYSPLTNDFADLYRNLGFYSTAGPQERKVVATDGVKGTFRGGYLVQTSFGPVSYGIQYTYYGFQPIGRFGNYSLVTGQFHPDPGRPWYNAEHAF